MNKILITIALITLLLVPTNAVFADNVSGTKDQGSDFSKAYKKFQDEQEGFREAKDKYENEKQEAVKNQYIEHSQKVLESSINVLIKRNEQLRKQIEGKQNLYGDLGKDIIGMLDSDNQKLDEYTTEINSASTTQMLSQAAAEIKTYRTQQQSYLRKIVLLAHINQYENTVIQTAQNRSDKLSQKITILKNQNKDVSGLEDLLSQANDKINQARQKLSEIRDDIKTETIDSIKLSDIERNLSDAQKVIKDAYQLFKQIAINGNELFSKNVESINPIILPISTSTASSIGTSTATSTQ